MSKSVKRSIDRFSSLPEHVAHKVISMEDISRLCVVSKICRELCISIPILNLNAQQFQYNATKQGQLMRYVDRFWLLRRGMATQGCYIHWYLQSHKDQIHILSWLQNAVTCNVQLLDLHIILHKIAFFPLPPDILRSKSLNTLRIHLNFGILNFPSSLTAFGYSSLHVLSLKSVLIDDSFGEWISSYCNFLKKLDLQHIRGTKRLIISSSSLRHLQICFAQQLCHIRVSAKTLRALVVICGFDSSSTKTELQFSAPNLKFLYLIGDISNFSSKDNFIHSHTTGIINLYSFSINFSTKGVASLHRGVHLPKILYLNGKCVENGCLPTTFNNLSILNIQIFSSFDGISERLLLALKSLLAGTPNLLHLYVGNTNYSIVIDEKEKVYGKAMRSGELHSSMVIPNLMSVIINLSSSLGKNELDLIKYLLEGAKHLQKMDIYNAPPSESQVIREIRQYEKAAQVSFHSSSLVSHDAKNGAVVLH
ncbi:hypothetical protein UlMin_037053 [Ulmus minor]